MSNQTRSVSVIAHMTDFGIGDGDVGVMKGVMLAIAPEARIIDVTHHVQPQNVASGAWILAASYRYFPKGTVFVCVVDPGVGSSRAAIAVHAGDWYFVGPDNGLFSYIYREQRVHGAVLLSNSEYHLPQVSSTFHGRDIFAPVAAHLASGVELKALGAPFDITLLKYLEHGLAVRRDTQIDTHIVHVDNFGNLITSTPLTMVPDLFTATRVQAVFSQQEVGALYHGPVDTRRQFFAAGEDDGRPFIYGDSSNYVGIAVRNGNAAKALGVGTGAPVTITIE